MDVIVENRFDADPCPFQPDVVWGSQVKIAFEWHPFFLTRAWSLPAGEDGLHHVVSGDESLE
jgi:hypothetical protein